MRVLHCALLVNTQVEVVAASVESSSSQSAANSAVSGIVQGSPKSSLHAKSGRARRSHARRRSTLKSVGKVAVGRVFQEREAKSTRTVASVDTLGARLVA